MQQSPESPQTERNLVRAAKQARATVTPDIVPTTSAFLKPALLHATNFYARNTQEHNLSQAERTTLQEIEAREEAARQGSLFLPTVGLEIEGNHRFEKVLAEAGFTVTDAGPSNPPDLREIRSEPSYSADTQIVFTQQLAAMGAILRLPGLTNEETPDTRLSLHMNFGIPFPVQDTQALNDAYASAVNDITDALTLAYTSPQRLEERKTSSAYTMYEPADTTDKFIFDPSAPLATAIRLELRSFEVTEMATPALLNASQRLVAGLIATMIVDQPNLFALLTPAQQAEARQLTQAFSEFRAAMSGFRQSHGGIPPNFMDLDFFELQGNNEPLTAVDLAQLPDIAADAREMIGPYVQNMGQILNLPESAIPQ